MKKDVTVLLVDDSSAFRRIARRYIEERLGLSVVGTAPSGTMAVQQALALSPDVILLDWHLPDGIGIEFIARLRASRPEARIIMVTMLDGAYRDVARRAGADGYVEKRWIVRDLLPEVERVAGCAGT